MKLLSGAILLLALASIVISLRVPCQDWPHFIVYLFLVMLASGLRVKMPGGESTISINFPFILLSIIDASPLQAILIAALSVLLQCTRRNTKFTAEQIVFNTSNSIMCTVAAWAAYMEVRHLSGELPPAVAAATAVYLTLNLLVVARMIGWATHHRVIEVLKQGLGDCAPYYLFAAAMAMTVSFIAKNFGWLSAQLIFPSAWACYRTVSFYVTKLEERKKHLEELASVHLRTIEALAMAIEAKDENTHDHLCRVRVYVEEIGKEMQLSDPEMKALLAGSLLHDIGKLAVPEQIITKPGKLTPEEFEKMKIHPIVGADILSRVGFPYPVVPIVRSHHERWDGKGYPDGLSGTEIPIGARILSAVDCFDALASDRPYRPAMPLDEAMAYLKKGAGTQFDPQVVAVMERRYIDLEFKASAAGKMAALNTSFQVARGEAPDAGFEQSGGPAPALGDGAARGGIAAIAAAGQEAQTLYQLGQKLGNSLSLDETLRLLSRMLRRLIPFNCFAMYLRDEDLMKPVFVTGDDQRLFQGHTVNFGEGLTGWVAQTGNTIINGNPAVELGPAHKNGTKLKSALAVPVHSVRDGRDRVLGVLVLYSIHADAFTRDNLRVLRAVSEKAAGSIENSLDYQRVESEAVTDFLTGILNSRGFALEAEKVLGESEGPLTLLACDLDEFKSVNDTEGHATGDQLLRKVAEILVTLCGRRALLGRLGGDEFVALVPGFTEHETRELMFAIDRGIKEASGNMLSGRRIGASIGAATFGPDGETVADVAAVADRRMYDQKRGAGENYRLLEIVRAS